MRRVTVYPSDFGLEQLEQESLHGPPKNIWKTHAQAPAARGTDSEDAHSDSEVEAEESGSDDSGSESSGSVDILDIEDMQKPTGSSRVKGADFIRTSSRPGVVLDLNADSEDDDEEVGEEHTMADGDSGPAKPRRTKKVSSDIDSVALRAYELSKLRYYFAIAELSDSQTANSVYKELDGMELEHSSMAMDLRFVPSDIRSASLFIISYPMQFIT